jgi:PHD/YefM family antitoxin component YafN of YafNO toxin-antitoxin module
MTLPLAGGVRGISPSPYPLPSREREKIKLPFLDRGGLKTMLDIKKDYVVTDDNKKKAVLIDIETFERIEEILESYGLGKYMEEIEDEEALSADKARAHYVTLKI